MKRHIDEIEHAKRHSGAATDILQTVVQYLHELWLSDEWRSALFISGYEEHYP